MALFQRQPVVLSQNLPYSISLSKATALIVGLGNPGKKYDLTRHNSGFMAIDNFATANEFPDFGSNSKFKGQISEKVLGATRVILFKPDTFMNLSGDAIRAVVSYYKISLENLVVVYDELSLPFGQIRSRRGGQSAGHKGVESLISQLGQDFGRLRIGIKNTLAIEVDSSDFVLKKFDTQEMQKLPAILNEAGNMLTEFIFSGKLTEQTRQIDVG